MMSLDTIRAMSAEAGVKAAKYSKQPKTFWDRDIKDAEAQVDNGIVPQAVRAIPDLGDYVPEGWEMLDQLFVDATGFGQEGELAMTLKQFVHKLEPDVGYGIVQAGQFQVYIGVFKRVG